MKSEENQVKEALFITVNKGQVKVSTGGMGMGFQEIVKKGQVEIY